MKGLIGVFLGGLIAGASLSFLVTSSMKNAEITNLNVSLGNFALAIQSQSRVIEAERVKND